MNLPPRFLNWRLIDGRKVPCAPDGKPCDAHDPANHTDYATAAARPYPVAFDLRAEDGLFFLDLDKCLGADGRWRPNAEAIFLSFSGAWGEVSQSGTGLHILGRCRPEALQDRKNKWDGWLEFYTDGRFIAFGPTGWAPIGGTAQDRDFTDHLLRVVPRREHLGELPDGRDPAYTGPDDDTLLIEMALRSTGGAGAMFGLKATFADLWNADAVKLARIYPAFDGSGGFDHSSADAALMAHLAFWTGRDMPRMDRLFRMSALMREKYEKREDYRRDTIEGAARLCTRVYDKPEVTVGVAGAYLTVTEMQEHFKGCVYIRNLHRILVPDGSLLRPEQFNASYGGHSFQMTPDGTKPTDEAFKALTQCKAFKFRQAVDTCFRPDLSPGLILDDGTVNVYIAPDVDMTPGDVSPFLDLLRRLLPDERDRSILLAYIAAVVQYPGVKFQWAPVLQGTEGNGKTLIFSCVAYAVGRQYTFMPNAKEVGGQFNGYLDGKIFILIEEFHHRGRHEALDDLKPLITNEYVKAENKGVDQRMIRNTANWAFCTNYKDAVLKSRNDRRYAVFFTAQQSVDDLKRDGMSGQYFPGLYRWLREGGGYPAVAHFLRTYPIPDEFNPAGDCHRAPETTATRESIQKSLGQVETEILEAVENDTPGFRGGWISSCAIDKLLLGLHIKIGRNKVPDILRDLGYECVGRASRPIVQEGGRRPVLYRKPGVTSDYAVAQNYPGFTNSR